MSENRPSLSFVVPCWNEQDGLQLSLETLRDAGDLAVAAGEIGCWEAVVVDDGSTDSTPEILRQAATSDPRIRVVTHSSNRGLGAAIRSGFAAVRTDLALYTDADMPCDLRTDVTRALRMMRLYDADIISAHRRGRTAEGPRRMAYSLGYNTLVRRTFGLRLRDVNFAFKLFNTATVDTSALRSEGSFVDVELLARAQACGLRIVQFETEYFPRTRGVSTLSSVSTIKTIIREMNDVGRSLRAATPRADVAVPAQDSDDRTLIVNADDFGLTPGVSEGIVRAAEAGVVTSTSVLVLGSGFAAAVPLLASAPFGGVGVHLALVGEDPPLLSAAEIPTLVDRRGRLARSWRSLLPRLARQAVDPGDILKELRAQIEAVQREGVQLSHLDTHQHLHLWPSVGDVVIQLAQEVGARAIRVPRSIAPGPKTAGINRLAARLALRASQAGLVHPAWAAGLDEAGRMHGGQLEKAIAALAARSGDVELSAHPGIPRDVDRYRWHYDWQRELDALCSREVRSAIEAAGFRLGSYHDLVRRR